MNNDEFLILKKELGKKSYLTDEEFEKYKPVLIECLKSQEKAEVRKKCSNSFNMQNEDLPDEEWRQHPGDGWKNYQISNLGRGKHKGEIVPQKDKEGQGTGWLIFDGDNFKNSVETGTYVYRMVAETFKNIDNIKKLSPNVQYEVHHINNNGYENTPENLIWLTKEQHTYIHKAGREAKSGLI